MGKALTTDAPIDLTHIAEGLRGLAVPIADLTPDAANARKHDQRNIDAIAASLSRFGQRAPIVVQKSGMVIRAGNGRVDAAKSLGWSHIAALVCDDDSVEAVAFAIADNRTAELADWDDETLASLLDSLPEDALKDTGFDQKELDDLMASLTPDVEIEEDEAPEPPADPVTKPGDLWTLGRHRVLCGDCTDERAIARLLGDDTVDLIATDPPYCSGGFQEVGKSSGSVGTSSTHKMVANDTLSTRGYTAMLKAAFGNLGAPYVYAFTDWRMWVYLFDIVESSGYGVRSMIVWDKSTPGMGRGWRAQHELIMWGCKQTPPFDKRAPGAGNVIQAQRTGNNLHTTEKPVELMAKLIGNVPFCETVADPFTGSGTTLIACHQTRRRFFGTELDAAYCDVAVTRWEKLTGEKATRVDADGNEQPGMPEAVGDG